MRNITSLSGVFLALILAGCGGSSDKVEIQNLAATVEEDTAHQQVLTNTSTNTPIVVQPATNGSIALNAQGFSYTPNADYTGSDTATIEIGKVRYVFTVDVTPVNDLPKLVNADLSVSATSQIEGKLDINDVDGDSVAATLISQPSQGNVALASDGTFTYTNDNLTLPNLSFEVKLDDGQGETVNYTINLSAAFDDNSDKSNYYYASNKSHLKLAQQRVENINDDTLTIDVYKALAQGYAIGAFDDQVTKIVTDNITTQKAQAEIFTSLATTYKRLGESEKRSEYLNLSLDTMLKYIADNGVENIERADVYFLDNILDEFADAGITTDIERATTALNTIFDQLVTPEYSFQYGYLTTSQRNALATYIEYYLTLAQDSPLKAGAKATAVSALKEYVKFVTNVGYRPKTSGDFADQPYHSVAPLYLIYATQYAMVLQEDELAKDYLAQSFSYYQAVDYDPKYQYPANQYAAATKNLYKFPLIDGIPFFRQLYPTLENLPLAWANLDPENKTDRNLQTRYDGDVAITEALMGLRANEPLTDIVANLNAHNSDSPYKQQYELAGRSFNTLALAQGIFNLQRDDDAVSAVRQGLDITLSDALVDEKGTKSNTFTLGNSGCGKYVGIFLARGLSDDAKATAQRCLDEMFTPHFSTIGGDITADKLIDAAVVQSNYFIKVGDNQKSIPLLKLAAQHVTDIDLDDSVSELSILANRAMASSDATLALTYLTQAKDAITNDETLSNTNRFKVLFKLAEKINGYDYYDSSSLTFSAENELRRRGYNDEKFAENLTKLRDISSEVNAQLIASFKLMAEADQIKNIDDVIVALGSNRQYQDAQDLLTSLALPQANNEPMLIQLSVIQALQEDFPGSSIASVDSDGDGKANFFAITAKDDETNQSDITLDLDSDGDGIPDAEDPTPLG